MSKTFFPNQCGISHFVGKVKGMDRTYPTFCYKASPPQSTNYGVPSKSQIMCQICDLPGHSALDCYYHHNYSFHGHSYPRQHTAMQATHNSGPNLIDHSWYIDRGAINHVTSDLANLSTHSDYSSLNQVVAGNSLGFSITHNSYTTLSTYSHDFCCTIFFVFHGHSLNLLSVQKFIKNNNYTFEFHIFGFGSFARTESQGDAFLQHN